MITNRFHWHLVNQKSKITFLLMNKMIRIFLSCFFAVSLLSSSTVILSLNSQPLKSYFSFAQSTSLDNNTSSSFVEDWLEDTRVNSISMNSEVDELGRSLSAF